MKIIFILIQEIMENKSVKSSYRKESEFLYIHVVKKKNHGVAVNYISLLICLFVLDRFIIFFENTLVLDL